MKRINVLYRMDGLLKECKSCERPFYDSPEKRCQGCSIYTQLREIGEQLEGKIVARKGIEMTVEEFVQLHYMEGLNYEQIGELKGVDKTAVSNWKYNRREEVEKVRNSSPQAHSEVKEVSESPRKAETDTGALQDLRDKAMNGRIENLEGQLAEAEQRYDRLGERYDDLKKVAMEWEKKAVENAKVIERLEAELAPIRQLAYLKLKQDLA